MRHRTKSFFFLLFCTVAVPTLGQFHLDNELRLTTDRNLSRDVFLMAPSWEATIGTWGSILVGATIRNQMDPSVNSWEFQSGDLKWTKNQNWIKTSFKNPTDWDLNGYQLRTTLGRDHQLLKRGRLTLFARPSFFWQFNKFDSDLAGEPLEAYGLELDLELTFQWTKGFSTQLSGVAQTRYGSSWNDGWALESKAIYQWNDTFYCSTFLLWEAPGLDASTGLRTHFLDSRFIYIGQQLGVSL